MKKLGVVAILCGGALLFFGVFLGFQTGLGFRVMNLPMAMLGGILFLGGLILFVAAPQVASTSTSPTDHTAYFDKNKWNALVKYDQEIGLIAEKLKPLGDKWVNEFAVSYLALNDKKYLEPIALKIISQAKDEDARKTDEESHETARRNEKFESRGKAIDRGTYMGVRYMKFENGAIEAETKTGSQFFESLAEFKTAVYNNPQKWR
jgi:hypothetical protein